MRKRASRVLIAAVFAAFAVTALTGAPANAANETRTEPTAAADETVHEGYPSRGDIIGCVATGPVDCIVASQKATQAETAANDLVAAGYYPADSLHNGIADAFRHCFWNALMAGHLGIETAAIIANRHEEAPGQPIEEKNMDLHNNAHGRGIGAALGTQEDSSRNQCIESGHMGLLVTLK
jgi:hypothetical protein